MATDNKRQLPLPPNPTVESLIQALQLVGNKQAMVCIAEVGDIDKGFEYATIEICAQIDSATYIDDAGDEQCGDIVYLF